MQRYTQHDHPQINDWLHHGGLSAGDLPEWPNAASIKTEWWLAKAYRRGPLVCVSEYCPDTGACVAEWTAAWSDTPPMPAPATARRTRGPRIPH